MTETMKKGNIDSIIEDIKDHYQYKNVVFKECALAGVSYHLKFDDELWDELEEGVALALVRDKKNKYDSNAVAVCLANDFDGDIENFDFDFILGYLPRTANSEVAAMLDAGYADKLSANIYSFKNYGNINDRIHITIYISTAQPVFVRPDLFRAHYLELCEMEKVSEELMDRGACLIYFGNCDNMLLPAKGENIVLVSDNEEDTLLLYWMRVIAEGDDCTYFLNKDVTRSDGTSPFILSNIVGPIAINISQCDFLRQINIMRFNICNYLNKTMSLYFNTLFRNFIDNTFSNDVLYTNLQGDVDILPY